LFPDFFRTLTGRKIDSHTKRSYFTFNLRFTQDLNLPALDLSRGIEITDQTNYILELLGEQSNVDRAIFDLRSDTVLKRDTRGRFISDDESGSSGMG